MLSVLPGLFCLTLALTPLVSPPSACGDDNGWVEGDTEEMRERPSSRRRPPHSQGTDKETGEQAGYSNDQRRNDDETQRIPKDPNYNERSTQENASNGRDPVLTIKNGGGTNTLTGGVTSSTFRKFDRSYRGLDKRSWKLLEQSPVQDILRDGRTDRSVQPSTFRNWLTKNHSDKLPAFSKGTIVEIKGQWDNSGHILQCYGLPFTRIPASKFASQDLSGTKVIVVNCGAQLDNLAVSRIREFVESGGYLLTTDWALDSCLMRAFPGFVQCNGYSTDNSIVDAVVVDQDPVLLSGLPQYATWKLESRSQTVKVLRFNEVQVLARSKLLLLQERKELAAILADREEQYLGILALTFPYGAGRVLHLVGHFDNNADRAFNNALPDPAPIIGIGLRQAIAGNFLVAALSGDAKVPPAPEN